MKNNTERHSPLGEQIRKYYNVSKEKYEYPSTNVKAEVKIMIRKGADVGTAIWLANNARNTHPNSYPFIVYESPLDSKGLGENYREICNKLLKDIKGGETE